MPKILKIISAISAKIIYLFKVASVYAQENPLVKPPKGSVGTDIKAENIPQLIINLIFGLAIFLAVVYLMYGGIRWMTSRGDKVAVESARKHIMSAVIGLVVVAGTFFILNVVFNILGADNPLKDGFKIPTLKNVGE